MSVFMQPIFTQTVGSGGAASITFNNIPQGFTDLKIEVSARGTTGSFPALFVYFNGDASTHNSYTYLDGTGSGVASTRALSYPVIIGGFLPGASETTNTFGNSEIYIPNYASGNYKQIIVDSVSENNASSAFQLLSANLNSSTSPITSITLYASPNSFAQYSTFTLYGVAEQYSTQTPVAPTIGAVTDQAGFAVVAFTPTTPDQAVTYAVTDSSSNTTYGASSPIVAPVTLGTSTTFTAKAINSLGTASSATSSAVTSANSYASIKTYNATGSDQQVNITNIPQNYSHLQVRIFHRSTSSNTGCFQFLNVNGVYQSPYTQYTKHGLVGDGSSASSYGTANAARIEFGYPNMANASMTAGIFSVTIIDILDYASTSKYKTIRILTGTDANGSGSVQLASGVYLADLTAITQLNFTDAYGNYAVNSQIALYGIA